MRTPYPHVYANKPHLACSATPTLNLFHVAMDMATFASLPRMGLRRMLAFTLCSCSSVQPVDVWAIR